MYVVASHLAVEVIMSSSVLNVDSSKTDEELESILSNNSYRYIHFSLDESSNASNNIIQASFHDQHLKNKLITLTNAGFMPYVHRGNTSSLVHHSEIKNLWVPVRNGEFSIDKNGMVYTLERAVDLRNEKLLVIFSQIPLEPYSASLYRFFANNFSTINKYIGDNISILRIADIGGVTGAFYLNTKALPENEQNVQELIANVARACNIEHADIVLYGTSKGGTASLYHGLKCNYKVISVDPILDDTHYISNLNDFHLIDGVFPQSKRELFIDLIGNYKCGFGNNNIILILSENSEQFSYINNVIGPIEKYLTVLNNVNDKIKKHPDVGPFSIHAIVSLINISLFGFTLEKKSIDFI